MPSRLIHEFQLKSHVTGQAIISAGGAVIVTQAGSYSRLSLTDPDNDFAALAQPVSLTRGHARFAVDVSVNEVDVYGIGPDGRAFVFRNLRAQELPEIAIDTMKAEQMLVLPFHVDDLGAASEFDFGLDLPADCVVLPQGGGVDVKAADATETIDVGLLSTEGGGDADGFFAALSVANTGLVLPTLASGGQTLGALLREDEGGTGELVPEGHRIDGTAVSVSATLTAGSDTAAGLIQIPYVLAP